MGIIKQHNTTLHTNNMPHSAASKKKVLDRAAEKFHSDLQEKLGNSDLKKMQSFYNAVRKLRAESATPEVVIAKINSCMKKYPEFCNRVVGFHPDGSIKLKEETVVVVEPMMMMSPPARFFTNDALMSIVACLPFPSIGRLAKSCKWMNAHITEEQVEQALKRGRERFGKVELFTSPSSAGGMNVLRLFSTNEEMVEIWRMSRHSTMYALRTNGRTFFGVTHFESSNIPIFNPEIGGAAVIVSMPEIFEHVIINISSLEVAAGGGGGQSQAILTTKKSVLWFKDVFRPSKNAITISFLKISGTCIRAAQCSMRFDEFVPLVE